MLLNAAETSARVAVTGAKGALWHPHCARIQPAKLVRGLAAAALALGVELYEGTAVTEIRAHRAVTEHGAVDAGFVVRATEGFTAGLRGHRRTWLPMNSSLIVTEPLPDATWESIGWDGYETLGDAAHAYMYAQRTADGRIALGGRGVPYRFGSRTDVNGATRRGTGRQLAGLLGRFFPAARGAAIDHVWSGVLGVPRDWTATVQLERVTGLAAAGGYVGTGVATANLAGRTLTDLILGRDTPIDPAALGQPPRALLGTRAAALARGHGAVCRLPHRRPRRGAPPHDVAAWRPRPISFPVAEADGRATSPEPG